MGSPSFQRRLARSHHAPWHFFGKLREIGFDLIGLLFPGGVNALLTATTLAA
jgi:hypothetical protein